MIRNSNNNFINKVINKPFLFLYSFIIYSKRMDVLEATLRILCMTDGKEGIHTLEKQEEFTEIVKSRDVEVHIKFIFMISNCLNCKLFNRQANNGIM